MKIALGSDHAGFAYKEKVKALLISLGHEVMDCGTDSEASVPYPKFIRPAAQAVANGECERGIVFGGSGNGEAMVANKVKGVRCAYVWNSQTAQLGRRHNDANVMAIGQRMIAARTEGFEAMNKGIHAGGGGDMTRQPDGQLSIRDDYAGHHLRME